MSDIDYMNECTVRDVAVMLQEDNGMSLTEALNAIYLSDTFKKLQNPATGLYFQSPVYVYDVLQKELI